MHPLIFPHFIVVFAIVVIIHCFCYCHYCLLRIVPLLHPPFPITLPPLSPFLPLHVPSSLVVPLLLDGRGGKSSWMVRHFTHFPGRCPPLPLCQHAVCLIRPPPASSTLPPTHPSVHSSVCYPSLTPPLLRFSYSHF